MPESTPARAGASRERRLLPVPRLPADDQPGVWPALALPDGLGGYPLVRYAVAHEPGPHLPG